MQNTVFCFVGTQSIYVKTWGCSHNNSDSEYMAGQLAAYGYIITGTCNYVRCFLIYIVLQGWLSSQMVSMLDSGTEGPGFKSQP